MLWRKACIFFRLTTFGVQKSLCFLPSSPQASSYSSRPQATTALPARAATHSAVLWQARCQCRDPCAKSMAVRRVYGRHAQTAGMPTRREGAGGTCLHCRRRVQHANVDLLSLRSDCRQKNILCKIYIFFTIKYRRALILHARLQGKRNLLVTFRRKVTY